MRLYLVRHGQSTGNIGGTLMGQSDHVLTPLGELQARAAADHLAPYGPMRVYHSELPRARATAERIVASWPGGEAVASLVPDERLREIHLGDYEGRPWQEFEADMELTAAFAADPYYTVLPNGESLAQLETRVHAAVCDVLAEHGMDDSGVLCANAVANADAGTPTHASPGTVAAGGAATASGEACPAGTVDPGAVATGRVAPEHRGRACIVAHDGPIRAILNHYLGVPPQKWWTLSTTHGGVSLLEFADGCVSIRFINATAHLAGLEADTYVPAADG